MGYWFYEILNIWVVLESWCHGTMLDAKKSNYTLKSSKIFGKTVFCTTLRSDSMIIDLGLSGLISFSLKPDCLKIASINLEEKHKAK